MKTRLLKPLLTFSLLAMLPLLQGCEPEVGSPEWCGEMREKPKGDWSANEAKEYAVNCIF